MWRFRIELVHHIANWHKFQTPKSHLHWWGRYHWHTHCWRTTVHSLPPPWGHSLMVKALLELPKTPLWKLNDCRVQLVYGKVSWSRGGRNDVPSRAVGYTTNWGSDIQHGMLFNTLPMIIQCPVAVSYVLVLIIRLVLSVVWTVSYGDRCKWVNIIQSLATQDTTSPLTSLCTRMDR